MLARLTARHGLVGIVSGRPLAQVRALVPVSGLLAAGLHGLELDLGDGPVLADGVARYAPPARTLAAQLQSPAEELGAWVEEKGLTVTVHWRTAPNPATAAAALRPLAERLGAAAGFRALDARMAVELRPPVDADKGSAVRALVAARPVRRSLYCGDDVTDLDAFREVDLAVAVRSDESPPGLLESAGLTVPDALWLLRALEG